MATLGGVGGRGGGSSSLASSPPPPTPGLRLAAGTASIQASTRERCVSWGATSTHPAVRWGKRAASATAAQAPMPACTCTTRAGPALLPQAAPSAACASRTLSVRGGVQVPGVCALPPTQW